MAFQDLIGEAGVPAYWSGCLWLRSGACALAARTPDKAVRYRSVGGRVRRTRVTGEDAVAHVAATLRRENPWVNVLRWPLGADALAATARMSDVVPQADDVLVTFPGRLGALAARVHAGAQAADITVRLSRRTFEQSFPIDAARTFVTLMELTGALCTVEARRLGFGPLARDMLVDVVGVLTRPRSRPPESALARLVEVLEPGSEDLIRAPWWFQPGLAADVLTRRLAVARAKRPQGTWAERTTGDGGWLEIDDRDWPMLDEDQPLRSATLVWEAGTRLVCGGMAVDTVASRAMDATLELRRLLAPWADDGREHGLHQRATEILWSATRAPWVDVVERVKRLVARVAAVARLPGQSVLQPVAEAATCRLLTGGS